MISSSVFFLFFEICLALDMQITPDGFTFLEKAIIEHNMLAIGKIYDNIQLPELTNILLIDERRTQKVCYLIHSFIIIVFISFTCRLQQE